MMEYQDEKTRTKAKLEALAKFYRIKGDGTAEMKLEELVKSSDFRRTIKNFSNMKLENELEGH